MRAKSVTVRERVPEDSLVIQGDREKLAHVFDSLIAAALREAEPGGEIRAEFSRGIDQAVSVQISGTGVRPPQRAVEAGSPKKTSAVQAHDPDAGFAELAAVQDIVFLHGGRISVVSRAGEGSTFVFVLPAIHA
jgi:signal transduction histidine kinase